MERIELKRRVEIKKGLFVTITLTASKDEGNVLADDFGYEYVNVTGVLEANGLTFDAKYNVTDLSKDDTDAQINRFKAQKEVSKFGKVTVIRGTVNRKKKDAIITGVNSAQLIKDAVDEMIAEAQAEISIEEKTNEQEANEVKTQKIEAAKELVNSNDPEELMTDAEKKVYLKKYKKINNEGGEGYTPKIVTKEMYMAALELLKSENTHKEGD